MVQIITGLGEQLCVLTTKETPRQVGTGWKNRSIPSLHGVRIILIDPRKLFRMRIPKYALSFEPNYEKKSPNPVNDGIFRFSLFV